MRPRLGVINYAPIQYHTPLYQLITRRGNVELDVLFLSDRGSAEFNDTEFGVSYVWDIDLMSGYSYTHLNRLAHPRSGAAQLSTLWSWIGSRDCVVVCGYNHPWLLTAIGLCRVQNVPFIMRGSSHPQARSQGLRRQARKALTRVLVPNCAAALSMGELNEEFYRQNKAKLIFFAPNSVDNSRFAAPPEISRQELLDRWGLDHRRPVILYSGKLYPRKRPFDVLAAARRISRDVSVIFVGDGVLASGLRDALRHGEGAVTGFVNQSEMPAYYHAADVIVLPSEYDTWGMSINEAMAAGAIPVVSDKVGCGPDLVRGLGEIYPRGNIEMLASALCRALERADDPSMRAQARRRVGRYGLDHTAEGFEAAAFAVSGN